MYSEVSSNLIEMLMGQARRRPDQVVYRFLPDQVGQAETQITYLELLFRSKSIAAELQRQGLLGSRVVLLFRNDLDYIVSFFGAILAGAVPVPLYPPHSNKHLPRLMSILKDCDAACALTTHALYESMSKSDPNFEQSIGIHWIKIDEINPLNADEWAVPSTTPNTLAFLQYTSGSTGKPKGVMLSHENLMSNFQMISEAMQVREGDVMVSWLPMYHDMGLIGAILHSVYAGIESVFMSPTAIVRPNRWLQAISKYRGTVTVAPNFAYDICVEKISDDEKSRLDLSSLRVAFNGAEPVKADTIARFCQHFQSSGLSSDVFLSCYGLAEATLIVTGRDMSKPKRVLTVDRDQLSQHHLVQTKLGASATELVSCGKVYGNQSLKIINLDTLQSCVVNEVGEIWISGKNVAHGYWNRPELDQDHFVSHEGQIYFRSGDLGALDESGELYITGRIKDLIIVRGKNFSPHDLEEVSKRSHPSFRDGNAAAISVEGESGEEVVIIQEVKKLAGEHDLAALTLAIKENVSREYGLNVGVCLVEAGTVARTSSGKVRRQEMKKIFSEGKLVGLSNSPTHSEVR